MMAIFWPRPVRPSACHTVEAPVYAFTIVLSRSTLRLWRTDTTPGSACNADSCDAEMRTTTAFDASVSW